MEPICFGIFITGLGVSVYSLVTINRDAEQENELLFEESAQNNEELLVKQQELNQNLRATERRKEAKMGQ